MRIFQIQTCVAIVVALAGCDANPAAGTMLGDDGASDSAGGKADALGANGATVPRKVRAVLAVANYQVAAERQGNFDSVPWFKSVGLSDQAAFGLAKKRKELLDKEPPFQSLTQISSAPLNDQSTVDKIFNFASSARGIELGLAPVYNEQEKLKIVRVLDYAYMESFPRAAFFNAVFQGGGADPTISKKAQQVADYIQNWQQQGIHGAPFSDYASVLSSKILGSGPSSLQDAMVAHALLHTGISSSAGTPGTPVRPAIIPEAWLDRPLTAKLDCGFPALGGTSNVDALLMIRRDPMGTLIDLQINGTNQVDDVFGGGGPADWIGYFNADGLVDSIVNDSAYPPYAAGYQLGSFGTGELKANFNDGVTGVIDLDSYVSASVERWHCHADVWMGDK